MAVALVISYHAGTSSVEALAMGTAQRRSRRGMNDRMETALVQKHKTLEVPALISLEVLLNVALGKTRLV